MADELVHGSPWTGTRHFREKRSAYREAALGLENFAYSTSTRTMAAATPGVPVKALWSRFDEFGKLHKNNLILGKYLCNFTIDFFEKKCYNGRLGWKFGPVQSVGGPLGGILLLYHIRAHLSRGFGKKNCTNRPACFCANVTMRLSLMKFDCETGIPTSRGNFYHFYQSCTCFPQIPINGQEWQSTCKAQNFTSRKRAWTISIDIFCQPPI